MPADRAPLAPSQEARRIRSRWLPYGHQTITEADIQAVVEVLRSEWLTTGPKVEEFEEAVASFVGARHAVAFSSGTAALHAAAFAAGLGPGDEAVTTALTFCATANSLLYQGARPVFADVRSDALTLDPQQAARKIGSRTRAILPMDYAGHPADLDAFLKLAEKHRLVVIEDAAQALGAITRGKRVGSMAHMTVFSFHPVKMITTGEGGMVTTDNPEFARRLSLFRNHGIESDPWQRETKGVWFNEMVELGHNYRLSDLGCALGISQLKRLPAVLGRRRQIACAYSQALKEIPGIQLPVVLDDVKPAWHLYPIRLRPEAWRIDRDALVKLLHQEKVGVGVHHLPVYFHPYYRRRFGDLTGECPVAEEAYSRLLSLPLFHGMSDQDLEDVVEILRQLWRDYGA